MKKMIIVAVAVVFSTQALGAAREVKRGNTQGKSKEEIAREQEKTAKGRVQKVESGSNRQSMQHGMDQKAMAADLVLQSKAKTEQCDTVCADTIQTVETLIQDPSRYEGDAVSAKNVGNFLVDINQGVVSGKELGVAVEQAAAKNGIDTRELVEACK